MLGNLTFWCKNTVLELVDLVLDFKINDNREFNASVTSDQMTHQLFGNK